MNCRNSSDRKEHLTSVDLIRAVASMAVCLYHLVYTSRTAVPDDALPRQIAAYGYIGLFMFFILSGFIIPYSIPSDYKRSYSKVFLLKRLVRIEPPYIASILLVIVLNYLSAMARNTTYTADMTNILMHLGYLNNFIDKPYLNPVYWTLGLEFQFYLLIALIFSFLTHNKYVAIAIILLFSLLTLIPTSYLLLNTASVFFSIGMLSYLKFSSRINMTEYICTLSVPAIILFFFSEPAVQIASVLTLLILFLYKRDVKTVRFFSDISFSLYLTHCTIGGKVIHLINRLGDSLAIGYLAIAASLVLSIGFAYLFYLFIEKPSLNYAKKIRYT